jgi:uncharacterized oxidoreductase
VRLSGNSVLITGGATGIGLALAQALVENGNSVAICGRTRRTLLAAKRVIPELQVKVCDVSRPRSRQTLLRWVHSRLPEINVLVNNAGIQRPIDFSTGGRDLAHADAELATNLAAPIHLCGLFVPTLRKREHAAIINISSGLAFTPLALVPVYCATKAAIHSLSLSLRHQLSPTGIRVFEIIPPIVATGLSGPRRRPADGVYVLSAEAVAKGIMEALESDSYEVAIGSAKRLYENREKAFEMINGGRNTA